MQAQKYYYSSSMCTLLIITRTGGPAHGADGIHVGLAGTMYVWCLHAFIVGLFTCPSLVRL